MPTVRGKSDVRRFIAQQPSVIETKLLRGAARAAGRVIAEEAKDRAISSDVREAITLKSRAEVGRITV